MGKMTIREKVLFVFGMIGWIFGSVYGLHDDWTVYVIVCPMTWIIPGMLLAYAVCGKNPSKFETLAGILAVPIIASAAFILIHRDTDFIIGRLVTIVTMTIALVAVVLSVRQEEQNK